MAKEDPEIRAMKRVERALRELDAAAADRVLRWAQSRALEKITMQGCVPDWMRSGLEFQAVPAQSLVPPSWTLSGPRIAADGPAEK
jgi:hypothetical protein